MSRYTIPHTIHHTLLTSLEILVGTAGCNKSYLFTSGCLAADGKAHCNICKYNEESEADGK